MNLSLTQQSRWCAVEPVKQLSKQQLRDDILNTANIQSDFSIITVPAPAYDQTIFKVYGNDKDMLIGVALLDSMPGKTPVPESLEVLFDLRHDHLGFFQFVFNTDGTYISNSFLPYPEAHSSAFALLQPKKFETTSQTDGSIKCRWFFLWFDAADVFRDSPVCGFNICRSRDDIHEFSSWNYLSGNGALDATGFGHLFQTSPEVILQNVTGALNNGVLHVYGTTAAKLHRFEIEVTTPLGEKLTIPVEVRRGQWQAEIILPGDTGRYALTPRSNGRLLGPEKWFFDISPADQDFCVSVTYDMPDNIMPEFYTPERLGAEIKEIEGWGVQRLHWIDYSDWPSFWQCPPWDKHGPETMHHCGDLLRCAVEQAHQNRLDIFADFKVFDLGFNMRALPVQLAGTVRDLEDRYGIVIPEIEAHQDWTMQANPDWSTPPVSLPVRTLRLYSKEPIPEIGPDNVCLLTSHDNRSYSAYGKPFEVKQGVLRRPHYRWTSAGKIKESGSVKNWYIELSGLAINELYAAIKITGQDVTLVHQAFLVMETEDASGKPAPVTVATEQLRDKSGYSFWKKWPGWSNYTEGELQQRRWNTRAFAFTFQEMPNMPTMLEPSYEGTRDIWLSRVQRLLDSGVDGISIRSFCHHNGTSAWLRYAFAPAVIEIFQSLYGRAPQTIPEDYERVRRIRGDYFTQFLREAKTLTGAAGKRFACQIESGIEIPAHLDTRMQIVLDYKTWLADGIVDEIQLKWWTAQSPWIHENVLPLARKNSVPVHIISRNLSHGLGMRAMETTPQLLTNAVRAGFAGFNFYEVANIVSLNHNGKPMLKGLTAPALTKAAGTIRSMSQK